MQKIIVKNFGPIKEVELEIQDFMVFIGPQASGKSTIANILYFFTELRGIFRNALSQHSYEWAKNTFKEQIKGYFRNQFGDGQLNLNPNFILSCFYSPYLIITIKAGISEYSPDLKDIEIQLNESINFVEMYETFQKHSKIEKEIHNNGLSPLLEVKSEIWTDFVKKWTVFFNDSTNYTLIIPELRSANLANMMAGKVSVNYGNWNDKYDSYNRELEQAFRIEEKENNSSSHYEKLIRKILKGEYIKQNGEWFFLNKEGINIPFKYSSSGQKEALPLLKVIKRLLSYKNHSRLIIEEPELGLYPAGQKYMTEVLALAFNSLLGNQILITTHSPYILTSLNNLLTAYKTAQMSEAAKEEVKQILPEEVWLNPEKLAVYFVAEGVIKSVVNEKTGLIGEQELDEVSDLIGDEFDTLMEIRRKFWNLKPQV
jgi:predicted ATPase